MRYDKPWLSLEEQADLLAQRSLEGDRAVVIEHLRDVGYYRLSGYWHVFKNEDDSFRPGTTFDRVWGLYVFDRQLRLTTLDAIERVEVFMRSRLAYYLADKTGVFGYLERPALPRLSQEEYLSFLKRCMDCYGRSREPFADLFRKVYGDECGMPPYWVMVNLMEMGLLLRLYKGASCDIRGEIASEVGVTATVLDSWLVALNTVRNICAHHSRLWNRPFGTRPMIPRAKNDARWHEPYKVESDRIFGVLTILSCLLEVIAPDIMALPPVRATRRANGDGHAVHGFQTRLAGMSFLETLDARCCLGCRSSSDDPIRQNAETGWENIFPARFVRRI